MIHTGSRSLSRIAWFLITLCLLGMVVESATAQIARLVVSGDAAPDGSGTISSIEPIYSLNNNGQVAFFAQLTGTQNPGSDAHGIFIANTQSIKQLVRTGTTAPDGNGSFKFFSPNIGLLEKLVVNDNGKVAFMALLTGTAGDTSDDIGLFGASVNGGVVQFARFPDSAPDGNGVFARTPPDGFPLPEVPDIGLSTPGVDHNGNAIFHGILTDTSGGLGIDDSGAFRSNGKTITRLVRAGETMPGSSTDFENIYLPLASNSSGQVAIHTAGVSVYDPVNGHLIPGLERIYIHDGAMLQEVVRDGVIIAEGNGTLTSFGEHNISDDSRLMFLGNVGNSDNFLLDGIYLFRTDGTTLTQIARQGQIPPGETDASPFGINYFVGLDSSNHDKVVFSASLHRNAVPPSNISSAIYRGDGNGLTLVVHQGDAVPDGNGFFGDVAVPVFLNNNGEFVFSALLVGTDNPPDDTRGIFFVSANGTVQLVARNGVPLLGSTILTTLFVGEFVGHALDKSDLHVGGMNLINDSGQIAFGAVLLDGRRGIFLWPATNEPPDDDLVYGDSFE